MFHVLHKDREAPIRGIFYIVNRQLHLVALQRREIQAYVREWLPSRPPPGSTMRWHDNTSVPRDTLIIFIYYFPRPD